MDHDIALCMIVKNEEDWIEKAVSSVICLVDEVIIADTGSTDRTLDRVARFNPKIIRTEWRDHFGDARNISLEAASCSWILVLDADECIAERDLPVIKRAVGGTAAGYNLTQRNYVHQNQVHGWQANTSDYQEGRPYPGFVDNPLIRLFRNDPQLRFQGAVHEIIDPTRLPDTLEFSSLPVVIHHFGKVLGEDRVQAKKHLYLKLGRKKLRDDPENAKAYLDLGIQLQELGQHAESREHLLKSFEMGGNPAGLLFCAMAEKNLKNYTVAEELLERAVGEGLDSFELSLELGNVALAQGKYPQALRRYKKCLERSIGNPVATFNIGLTYKKLEEIDKAVTYYRRASDLDSKFVEPRLELANIHTERGEIKAAGEVLAGLLQAHPDRREVRLALAKVYLQLERSDDALQVLDGRLWDDAVAESLRGAAYAQNGDNDRARCHLESAIRKDPSLIDARINISRVYGSAGRFALAAEHLRHGYDLTSDDSLLPALSLYEARADLLDDALPHLEKVFEFGQPSRDHWICRALVLERKQMWKELDAHYWAMVQSLPELRDWVQRRKGTGAPP